jgi:transcriptional regulator with XRE-family HTH domain
MMLRDWRTANGLTLEKAAAAFGISISKLCDIERGRAIVSRETIARIEGATAGSVGVEDHYAVWRKENPEQFAALRATGRHAVKAILRAAKRSQHGGKAQ